MQSQPLTSFGQQAAGNLADRHPLHSDERCMKIQLVNLADNAWSEKQNRLLGKFTARAVVRMKPSDLAKFYLQFQIGRRSEVDKNR